MTLDSLPDLDTSGLCLVKTLPAALTCWPYRNTALRDDGRTHPRALRRSPKGGRPRYAAGPRRRGKPKHSLPGPWNERLATSEDRLARSKADATPTRATASTTGPAKAATTSEGERDRT